MTPHRVALLSVAGAMATGTAAGVFAGLSATATGTVTATMRRLLPTGVDTTDDYTPTAGTVLNDCTATTGWTNGSNAGNVETSHGFTTVANNIQTGAPGGQYYRVDLPSDVPTTGFTRVVLEVLWLSQNGFPQGELAADYVSVHVAESTGLGGTKVVAPFPAAGGDTFLTVPVDVSSLTKVRSVGIVQDGANTVGIPGASIKFWVREVRFANETPLDRALEASTPSAVIVGPGYEPAVGQDPWPSTATRVTVDLRPGNVHISRLNGVRYLREWGVPEDGDTEVSQLVAQACNELADGETLLFPAGGLFRVEMPMFIRDRRRVTIDCNGSRFYWTTWRGGNNNVSDPGFAFSDSVDTTFKGARIHGWRDLTTDGAELDDDTGTPTVVGDTVTLTAEDDAVRGPHGARFYMRHLVEQFTPTVRALIEDHDPAFTYGTVATFRLSDSNQVADDVAVELVYADDDTVFASRVLTVTGTPTDYAITADPDPRRKYTVRARKATATANTVTVHEATTFGIVGYDIDHDSATAVAGGQGLRNFLVEDVHVEGASTDGFDFTHSTIDGVTLRNVSSRGACRQGMSFNYGRNFTVDGFMVGECGRSAVDIEPYGVDWWVQGVNIRHGRIWNATNYAFACNNWTQITDLHIDDVDLVGAGIGLIIGGGIDSSVTNVRSDPGPDAGTGKYAIFNGTRLRVSGVTHRGYLVLDDDTGGGDNTATDIMNRDADLIIRAGWSASNVRFVP